MWSAGFKGQSVDSQGEKRSKKKVKWGTRNAAAMERHVDHGLGGEAAPLLGSKGRKQSGT